MIVRAYNLTVKIYISKFNMYISSKKISHIPHHIKQEYPIILNSSVKVIENSTVANSSTHKRISRQIAV